MSATYKLRKLSKPAAKDGSPQYEASSLAVPTEIARLLPEGIRFTVEMTDDGILYRPAPQTPTVTGETPEWVSKLEGNGGSKAAAKAKAAAK